MVLKYIIPIDNTHSISISHIYSSSIDFCIMRANLMLHLTHREQMFYLTPGSRLKGYLHFSDQPVCTEVLSRPTIIGHQGHYVDQNLRIKQKRLSLTCYLVYISYA